MCARAGAQGHVQDLLGCAATAYGCLSAGPSCLRLVWLRYRLLDAWHWHGSVSLRQGVLCAHKTRRRGACSQHGVVSACAAIYLSDANFESCCWHSSGCSLAQAVCDTRRQQLTSLGELKLPLNFPCALGPHSPKAQLQAWKEVTQQEAAAEAAQGENNR